MPAETTEINIARFLEFCKSLRLPEWAERMQDSRLAPQISASQVFLCLILGGILRKRSLNQMDQFHRTPEAKALHHSSRYLVVSDSSLSRILSGFTLPPLRECLRDIYPLLNEKGSFSFSAHPLLPGFRLGLIDGTTFGDLYASCFLRAGLPADAFVDLQPYTLGHELPASHILLHRLVQHLGKRFVDLLLLDNLYVSQYFINDCIKADLHPFIKLKTAEEDSLNVLKDARRRIRQGKAELVEGVDARRKVRDQVWRVEGLSFEGVEVPLTAAFVREEKLDDPLEVKTFWTLTTHPELSALQMRELGHLRWEIENRGFKMLNEMTHSKHGWIRDAHGMEALVLCMMVVFDLLRAFAAGVWKALKVLYGGGLKATMRFVSDCLLSSLTRGLGNWDTS